MRFWQMSGLLVAILIVIATVLLSPWLLDGMGGRLPIDSHRVSELGGSYSAASALLSALALCFLAGSTIVQIRQAKIGQLYSVRSLQLDLLRMAIDEPDYRAPLGVSLTPEVWRSHAYLNLWMMYLQMNFLTAVYNDDGARRFLSEELFRAQAGIDYWKRARSAFVAEATSRRHRRFVQVVDEEHAKAVTLLDSRNSVDSQMSKNARGRHHRIAKRSPSK